MYSFYRPNSRVKGIWEGEREKECHGWRTCAEVVKNRFTCGRVRIRLKIQLQNHELSRLCGHDRWHFLCSGNIFKQQSFIHGLESLWWINSGNSEYMKTWLIFGSVYNSSVVIPCLRSFVYNLGICDDFKVCQEKWFKWPLSMTKVYTVL